MDPRSPDPSKVTESEDGLKSTASAATEGVYSKGRERPFHDMTSRSDHSADPLLPLQPRRTWSAEDERRRRLEEDPDAYDVGPHSVTCRGCHRPIRLNATGRYYAANWNKHKMGCKGTNATEGFQKTSFESKFSGRVAAFRIADKSEDLGTYTSFGASELSGRLSSLHGMHSSSSAMSHRFPGRSQTPLSDNMMHDTASSLRTPRSTDSRYANDYRPSSSGSKGGNVAFPQGANSIPYNTSSSKALEIDYMRRSNAYVGGPLNDESKPSFRRRRSDSFDDSEGETSTSSFTEGKIGRYELDPATSSRRTGPFNVTDSRTSYRGVDSATFEKSRHALEAPDDTFRMRESGQFQQSAQSRQPGSYSPSLPSLKDLSLNQRPSLSDEYITRGTSRPNLQPRRSDSDDEPLFNSRVLPPLRTGASHARFYPTSGQYGPIGIPEERRIPKEQEIQAKETIDVLARSRRPPSSTLISNDESPSVRPDYYKGEPLRSDEQSHGGTVYTRERESARLHPVWRWDENSQAQGHRAPSAMLEEDKSNPAGPDAHNKARDGGRKFSPDSEMNTP